jgi:hypothetical protein
MKRQRQSVAVPLLCVLGAAWFALWACAPMSTLPVPGSMAEGQREEFGITADYTVSSSDQGTGYTGSGRGLTGQFWYRHRFGHWHLGGSVFAGQAAAGGAGVFFGGLFPVGKVNLGFDVAAGWLWAEVGMPLTVPLGQRAWFYTAPSVGLRTYVIRVPVGVGFRIGKHLTLGPELELQHTAAFGGSNTGAVLLAPGLGLTGAVNASYGF